MYNDSKVIVDEPAHGRKDAREVTRMLEAQIASSLVRKGELLPSIRSISRDLGCAHMTAYRAMRQLVERGVVTAEFGVGYRLTGSEHRRRAETVALLEETENVAEPLGHIYQAQIRTLQLEAMRRDWTFVLIPYRRQPVERIGEQLKQAGTTALIFQNIGFRFSPDLIDSLCMLGVPVINLDTPDVGIPGPDYVTHDEFHGGALAAKYLIGQGHRRIGWYGPLRNTLNSRRRFLGAVEMLLREGLELDEEGWRTDGASGPSSPREYLLKKDRPRAVLALWSTAAISLARSALELGLKLGKDIDIVGWCLDDHYDTKYAAACPELARDCAAVTWSMSDVGRSIFARIQERRRTPDLPTARILLPMKLREPKDPHKSERTRKA